MQCAVGEDDESLATFGQIMHVAQSIPSWSNADEDGDRSLPDACELRLQQHPTGILLAH